MARVLDHLKPLIALLGQARDPAGCAQSLAASVSAGAAGATVVAQLESAVVDGRLARPALEHAGVLDAAGSVTADAVVRLSQVAVLLEAEDSGGWDLVLTVPEFLRPAMDDLVAEHVDGGRPRETVSVLREVAGAARSRLLIAAPFLHAEFVQLLVPDVRRVLAGGGAVVVVTRALSFGHPARSTANVAAVTALRDAAAGVGWVSVFSWEESGLGVHFKVVLADAELAYLGSANMTPGGASGHAEAGELLRGAGVAGVARWLDAVCGELGRRRLPHS